MPGPASMKTDVGAVTQQLLLDGRETGGEPSELDFELRWRAKSGVIKRLNWWDYFQFFLWWKSRVRKSYIREDFCGE